jgi:hypothetical protein
LTRITATRLHTGFATLITLASLGCRYGPHEPCSADEMVIIDFAIDEADAVEPFVDEALAAAYDGDYPLYVDVLDRLHTVRDGDRIYCAEHGESDDYGGWTLPGGDAFVVNFDDSWAGGAYQSWVDYATYGDMARSEIPSLVAEMSPLEFDQLHYSAYIHHMAPSTVCDIVVHESAHLEAPGCCHHTDGADHDAFREDYAYDIGRRAADGVYWTLWLPESEWLQELYWSTHDE